MEMSIRILSVKYELIINYKLSLHNVSAFFILRKHLASMFNKLYIRTTITISSYYSEE